MLDDEKIKLVIIRGGDENVHTSKQDVVSPLRPKEFVYGLSMVIRMSFSVQWWLPTPACWLAETANEAMRRVSQW